VKELPRKGWTSISISEQMIDEIDKFIDSETGKKLGFRSRADVATAAVRALLEKYGHFEEILVKAES